MRRLFIHSLLCLCFLLFVACQNNLQSESGLYNVELQRNIKVPVKGYWTWGKGNPYASHQSGRIYIHPMDISKIRKSDPEAAPIMAVQMQDYLTQAIAAALQESNKANGTDWRLTANPAESDVCIHTALVDFRRQRPALKTINAVGGTFIDATGVLNIIGYVADGNVAIECTMRDTRTGQLLMAFKDANRKKIRLYSKHAYTYTGNADANLKEWATILARVIRASAHDKLRNSTIQKQIEEKSYWEAFSQRAYREIPDLEEINAWEAIES